MIKYFKISIKSTWKRLIFILIGFILKYGLDLAVELPKYKYKEQEHLIPPANARKA